MSDQTDVQQGTALIDSVARDVRYACRSFLRAPLVARLAPIEPAGVDGRFEHRGEIFFLLAHYLLL